MLGMMGQRLYHLLLVFAVGFWLSACTTPSERKPVDPATLAQKKGYELLEEVDKILNYRLNGWNHINSKALIVHTGPSRSFLLTLRTSCSELSNHEILATTSTSGSVRAGFDAVITRLPGSSASFSKGDTQKCYIDKIYRLKKAPKPSE